MVNDNLLININYREACGQSTLVDHLLTYSYDLGTFPQNLNEMSIRPVYIYNKDGDAVISPAIIHKSLMNMKVMSDHYSTLQEALLECTDIEGVLLSESNFKQILPHSVYNVNMPLSQKTFFVRQTDALYCYDWNKRFNYNSTIIFCEMNINRVKRHYEIGSINDDLSYDEVLTLVAQKIQGDIDETKEWLHDKPLSLCDMAVERGILSVKKIGIKKWAKEFLYNTHNCDTSSVTNGVVSGNNVQIEINELLTKETSTDYYKYICEKLDIQPNIELYNTFYDEVVCVTDYERLKLITNSKFLAKILCDETDN